MSTTSQPDYSFEHALHEKGLGDIAGIDEAGRGPWAGPVVAAAVILQKNNIPEGLHDSKKLTARKRGILFEHLTEKADIGIGIINVDEIDRINILQASLKAMQLAVSNLSTPPSYALIDGNKCPELMMPAQAVIKGDGKVLSIAAASIIAKVTRDTLMGDLGAEFPGYGWERNMGYGTKEHAKGLDELGVTPHHRRSFAPIKKILGLSE